LKARFRTECSVCKDYIQKGEQIVKVEENWIHKSCAPEDEAE
jgi:hypothetical protein